MEETEIDIRGILALLRRQLRMIVVTFIVVVALAVVVLFALTPRYSSSALIFVDPSSKNLLNPEMTNVNSASDNARVDSEVEIVRSQGVLLDVIESQALVADPEFGVSLGLREQIMAFLRIGEAELPQGDVALRSVIANLREALSVQRRGLTYLINVEVDAEDPVRAARLANAVADAYINLQVQSKIDAVTASQSVLGARLADARAAIGSSERAFDVFVVENLEQLEGAAGNELAPMRSQLLALTTERDATAALAASVQQYLQNNNLEATVAALESDALAALEAQRQQIASTLSVVEVDAPVVVNLRAELARIETELEERANAELTNLRRTVAGLESSASTLRQEIRGELLTAELPIDVLTRLFELQQSAELARTQYQTLLSRTSDLSIQADLQIADSRIISRALPSGTPSFPNSRLILMLAGLAGLGLGVGLAFLHENYIGGIVTEGQAQSILKAPVLAEVPRQKSLAGSRANAVSDVVFAAPLSHYSEAIRRLRAGVDRHLRQTAMGSAVGLATGPKGSVIMVTSSVPAEGKTTLALSLARTYAQSGQKTIIIDCDLRKPAVHQQLGLDPAQGLLDYLTGKATGEALSALLSIDSETGLSVMTGARASDIPTDQLLMGKAFERLMSAVVNNFDVVVLDTPPILPVVDGTHIAQWADIVTFIVRWANTSQAEARSAMARLEEAKRPETKIVSVLNQQESMRSSYLNRYASYYQEA